jgi:SAM-dependent methyltransferase
MARNRFLRGIWHLLQPIRNSPLKQLGNLPSLYLQYGSDWKRFRAAGGAASFEELSPQLFDRDSKTQSGGGHYFYQDIWALRKLAEFKPSEHHDVGSRFDGFVGQATAICPVVCYDIRPPGFQLPRLEFRFGSILKLPVPSNSIRSLSCLHVAEHVGLGRYGDALDPDGTVKGLKEMMRVLAPGGQLLFSIPVGRERVCFNAERVWNPEKPLEVLSELQMTEFKAVNDKGDFLESVRPADLANANYSCGLYCFSKD